MAIVLKRLQDRLRSGEGDFGDFSLENVGSSCESLVACLNKTGMESSKRAVFTLLVEEDSSLILEYDTLCALLKNVLDSSPETDEDKKAREEQATKLVYELLALAELQTYKYDHYITAPSNLTKSMLGQHQQLYKAYLHLAEPVAAKKEAANSNLFSSLTLPKTTTDWNRIRLYLIRIRRFLFLLTPIVENSFNYSSWFLWVDAYVAPALSMLAVVFFLPRLIYNIEVLCGTRYFDSIFQYPKLEPEKTPLNASVRFNALWNRLWPNLANDAAWAASGFILYFILIGVMQPFAIFLSVAMQFYDVVMASIRAYYELPRLNKLLKDHKNILSDSNQKYLECLEKSIARERAVLALSFANAFVLFCAISLVLPMVVAIHPLLPLVGAVMAIFISVINFESKRYWSIFKSQYSADEFDKKLRSNSVYIDPVSNSPVYSETKVDGGVALQYDIGVDPQYHDAVLVELPAVFVTLNLCEKADDVVQQPKFSGKPEVLLLSEMPFNVSEKKENLINPHALFQPLDMAPTLPLRETSSPSISLLSTRQKSATDVEVNGILSGPTDKHSPSFFNSPNGITHNLSNSEFKRELV